MKADALTTTVRVAPTSRWKTTSVATATQIVFDALVNWKTIVPCAAMISFLWGDIACCAVSCLVSTTTLTGPVTALKYVEMESIEGYFPVMMEIFPTWMGAPQTAKSSWDMLAQVDPFIPLMYASTSFSLQSKTLLSLTTMPFSLLYLVKKFSFRTSLLKLPSLRLGFRETLELINSGGALTHNPFPLRLLRSALPCSPLFMGQRILYSNSAKRAIP